MKSIQWKGIASSVKAYTTKHSPELLTGLGIGGFITSIITTAKASPKVRDAIAEEEYHAKKYGDPPPGFKTKARIYIHYYWPTAVSAGLSTACIVAGNRTSAKRNAALAAAYTLSETTLKEYQKAAIEEIGEKKELAIRDRVAKNAIENNPSTGQVVTITNGGDVLCYDKYSGRYFTSSIESIRRACNDLSRQLLSEMFVSLNEFYGLIGLDEIPLGSNVGWNVDIGLVEPYFSTQLDSHGKPCVVLDYIVVPSPHAIY